MARRRKVHVHDQRMSKSRFMDVPVNVQIERRGPGVRAAQAFEACAFIRKRAGYGKGRLPEGRGACATGRAPRRALAAAMKKFASRLIKRSSSFRGL